MNVNTLVHTCVLQFFQACVHIHFLYTSIRATESSNKRHTDPFLSSIFASKILKRLSNHLPEHEKDSNNNGRDSDSNSGATTETKPFNTTTDLSRDLNKDSSSLQPIASTNTPDVSDITPQKGVVPSVSPTSTAVTPLPPSDKTAPNKTPKSNGGWKIPSDISWPGILYHYYFYCTCSTNV